MSYLGRSAKLSLKAQEKVSFLATAGQTVKTGLSYTPSFIEVYVNGVLLTDTTDFTATNGNSITFTVALLLNDEVTVISLKTFTVADHYSKTEADTLLALKSTIASPSFTGKVGIGSSSPVRQLEIKDDGTLGQAIVGIIADAGDPAGIFMGTTSNNNVGGIRYFTDTNKLTLRANDEDRLLIDSAGIVTKPYQPAFFAYRSGSNYSSSSGSEKVLLDAYDYDINSDFNTSTARFNAPVAGRYFFTGNINCYSMSTDSYHMATLKVNGVVKAYGNRSAARDGGDWNVSVSAVLNMAAGDYVELWSMSADGTRTFSNGTWNHFSGHLIG